MTKAKDSIDSGRRRLLAGASAAGLGSLAFGASQARAGAHEGTPEAISVAQQGNYETVPLRQPAISVAAIQSRVRAVDINNLKKTMASNLGHVLSLIDVAQGSPDAWDRERRWGGKQDLICMHEFPIQGFQPWTRTELSKVAVDLPGPESEAIGKRAKEFGCYIAYGCYARDPDWPRHVINMSAIRKSPINMGDNWALHRSRLYTAWSRRVLGSRIAGHSNRARRWRSGNTKRASHPTTLTRWRVRSSFR